MNKQRKISVIGLGYVGLSIAVAFGKKLPIIGFDVNSKRITELSDGFDSNYELSSDELSSVQIKYSTLTDDLKNSDFFIITVPTLLDSDNIPDLSPLLKATALIAKLIKPGDIVVYECSVFPGVTEDYCIPILEQKSKLKCGEAFGVAYSPERVNPGDKVHTFANITKIVAATDQLTLSIVCDTYKSVLDQAMHAVSCIKVAEATKLMENIQRDINIAVMNEYSKIMHCMGLDVTEVFHAMQTKWNALNFRPGLVGGHCIGINAYYLAYKAQMLGVNTELIISARKINESMPRYIVAQSIKLITRSGLQVKDAKIAILGLTFKENCPDLKDTEVINLINALQKHVVQILVSDPIADKRIVSQLFNIQLTELDKIDRMDCIIVAVSHTQYIGKEREIISKLRDGGVVVDVKGILDAKIFHAAGAHIWQI